MHIIAGCFHGQILKSPSGYHTRPTLSRIRESLFNILAPRIRAARFLDLYAGAGSIGLEALSRGSRFVFFVESDRSVGRVLSENVAKFDPQGTATLVLLAKVLETIGTLGRQDEKFDIIFLDPPYDQGEVETLAGNVRLDRLLAEDGVVVLQHGRKENPPGQWAGCRQVRRRIYGETALTFYERGDRPELPENEDA
jgi:16S rRNA (guanine(966)-N(2))-methyltransferase RsmD